LTPICVTDTKFLTNLDFQFLQTAITNLSFLHNLLPNVCVVIV